MFKKKKSIAGNCDDNEVNFIITYCDGNGGMLNTEQAVAYLFYNHFLHQNTHTHTWIPTAGVRNTTNSVWF